MAIVHFVNRPRSQTKAGMLFVLRYCISDKKTVDADGEKYVSGINCVPQSAYAEFISTKKIFGKNDGRQYYHFVISSAPKIPRPILVLQIRIPIENH